MSRFLLLSAVLALTLCSVVSAQELVNITYNSLIPEGVEYHNGFFFASSIAFGTVVKVTLAGVATPFVVDTRLVSSAGLQVDAARGYLYVANTDFTKMQQGIATGFQSSVVVASLTNGTVLKYIDLSTVSANLSIPRFANDVTFDNSGHLYVSDSLGNQIWKIHATTNVPTTFVQDNRFKGFPFGPNFLGPNGIEFHNGYLILVISGSEGKIFKIPVNGDSAGTVTQVTVQGTAINLDGIMFFPGEDRFFAIDNGDSRFYGIESTNNFATAVATNVANTTFPTPTSVTFKDGKPYVISALGFAPSPWYPIFMVDVAGHSHSSVASQLSLSTIIPMICMIIALALF